jgi:hypothetical protein
MTVTIAGRKLKADPPALLAEYDARGPLQKPHYMLVCTRCKALCTIGNPCETCQNFGRAFGGKRVRTMSPHDRLPISEVLEALQAAVAA